MTVFDIGEATHGPSLEYQVFALCFLQEGAVNFFSDSIDPAIIGAIYGETGIHEFYKSIIDFHHQTGLDPVDPIAFRSWLEDTDIFSALGGEAAVRAFMAEIVGIEQLPDKHQALKLLQLRANKRYQMNAIQQLQLVINKKGAKTDEDRHHISELTEQISNLERELDFNPLDYVTTGNQMIDNVEDLLDIPSFVPTQFKELNKVMGYTEDGGFYRGAVHAILAASGKGKSTFCKSLCNNWLDEGYTVLYVNFEEAQTHWERILFTQVIARNVYKEADTWTQEQRDKYSTLYKAKLAQWGDRLMVRHDPDTPYFDDLELWFKDVMGHNDILPDIVVIDTIQSMFTKGSNKPRWAEFEQMMVRLEKLAREMDCVMIITAQQNANAIKEKREVINQADTGGSIAIQQKSSITMFITSVAEDGDETIDPSIMQLQVPKNRITGGAFILDPPMVKYDDDSKSYLPYDVVNYVADGNPYTPNNDFSKGIENL